jgi:UDP-N-acetylglucosamine 2-epimerase (non-hydrolysing)
MSPVIHELARRRIDFVLIHTGQHYSYDMDRQFFEELGLPEPKHYIPPSPPGALHGEQTGRMLVGIEAALVAERPRFVIVGGDANTNLAGALAARKLQLNTGHVEAGLRSHDWRMPEEHNRVMIDHISDVLFAPTLEACNNLRADNVRGRVILTGNTIVDAVEHMLKRRFSLPTDHLISEEAPYAVVTVHREENVDVPANLVLITRSVQAIAMQTGLQIIFPMHPRTRVRLEDAHLLEHLEATPNIRIIRPLSYADMLTLVRGSRFVATDSGGLQEEACILGIPCITLRENTERPETVRVGANRVAGIRPESVMVAVEAALTESRSWPNPFGDGRAAQRIVDTALGLPVTEWQPEAIQSSLV